MKLSSAKRVYPLMYCLFLSQFSWAQEAYMYRYDNDKGQKTVSFQVPPASIKYGYEILNKRLKVIKKVGPPPTKEELAKLENEKLVQQEEETLLKSFATSADAERARDRKITALEVITEITKGNILRLNMEYETLGSLAASIQRKGEPVPDHIKNNMESVERQISDAGKFIGEKEKEKEAIYDSYAGDIKKLKHIEERTAQKTAKK